MLSKAGIKKVSRGDAENTEETRFKNINLLV